MERPTAQVSSLTDSNGNAYSLALGPTVLPGTRWALIAVHLLREEHLGCAAGGNTVKVTFTSQRTTRTFGFWNIRALIWYPWTRSWGRRETARRAAAACDDHECHGSVGRGQYRTTSTLAPAEALCSDCSPPDGDIAEDRVVTAAGSYSATAPLAQAGGWVMQMVALHP